MAANAAPPPPAFLLSAALHNTLGCEARDWQAWSKLGKIIMRRRNAQIHSGRTSPSPKHSAETMTGSGVPGWKEETQVTHWEEDN